MPEQQWKPRIRRIDGDERERLQYVRSLIREKRVDEARDELLEILQQNDKSVRAHVMLGSLYQGQRMYAEALDHFNYAISLNPMDVAAHQRAGACCLRMDDIGRARAFLQTALDLDPKHIGALVGMAQALARSGETDAAIAHLEEALRLDPAMAAARMLMARLLSRSGKVDHAIEELDGFLNANPEHAGAAVRLAMFHGRQGNGAKAIELLEAATKSNPKAAPIWSLLGRQKLRVKDYAGAEKAFTEAVRLRPGETLGSLRLVQALIPQGKFDEARELLKKVPRRGRLGRLVHEHYGDMYAAQRMFEEAVQSYRAALLQGEGGDELVMALEKSAGPKPSPEALVSRYQAEIAKRREEARKQRAEQSVPFEGRPPRRGRRFRAGQFAVSPEGAP